MLKVYTINNVRFAVYTDDDMLRVIKREWGENLNGLEYIILQSYRYVLECVENQNVNYLTMANDVKDKGILTQFGITPLRYSRYCLGILPKPGRSIWSGSIAKNLILFEEKYGEKDSYYNKIIERLKGNGTVYVINSVSYEIHTFQFLEVSSLSNNFVETFLFRFHNVKDNTETFLNVNGCNDKSIFTDPAFFTPLVDKQSMVFLGAKGYYATFFELEDAEAEIERLINEKRAKLLVEINRFKLAAIACQKEINVLEQMKSERGL